MTLLHMSKALSLLENDPHSFIPYNFIRQDSLFLCEGLNPFAIQEELTKVLSKGHQVSLEVSQGLQKEKEKYENELSVLLKSYPHLHDTVNHDVALIHAEVQHVGKDLRSRLGKLPSQNESIGMKEIRGLLTLQALQNLSFPEGHRERVRDASIGFLGISLLLFTHNILYEVFSSKYDRDIAFALSALVFAPILEEFYKALSVKLTKSQLPSFIFSVAEFIAYSWSIFNLSMHLSSPVYRVFAIIYGILGRITGVNFHMTTAQAYLSDVEKYNTVRKGTYLKGVFLHSFFNAGAGMILFINNSITLFSALLGFRLSPNLPKNVTPLLAQTLSSGRQRRRVLPVSTR